MSRRILAVSAAALSLVAASFLAFRGERYQVMKNWNATRTQAGSVAYDIRDNRYKECTARVTISCGNEGLMAVDVHEGGALLKLERQENGAFVLAGIAFNKNENRRAIKVVLDPPPVLPEDLCNSPDLPSDKTILRLREFLLGLAQKNMD